MEKSDRLLIKVFLKLKKILLGTEDKTTQRYLDYSFWFLIVLFAAIYSFMSINNHRLFETYGWDLAVFDQGIWQWSTFSIPYSSFHDLPWLADHFHPILMLLAPLYWVFSDVRFLVSAQAVLTVFGAVPLYFLSKKVTNHRLFSLVLILGFLLFYSLQWHMFSGFHATALLPITLGGVMYFWEKRKLKSYWLSFLLALLVKEEIGLLLASFGVWALINDRNRWKQALVSLLLGVTATTLLVGLLMPAIGEGVYRHSGFGVVGNSPFEVALNVFQNPGILIEAFVDSPVKINTMLTTFWPWGFLPVFSPPSLILVIEQFASRFLDYAKTIRWTLFFAYSLPMASIMAWGSIYGFENLVRFIAKRYKLKKYLVGSVIAVILFSLIISEDYFLHAPINSLFKKSFYRTENWMVDNNKVLNCIPKRASVSAINSLAPHLSQRKKIKVFPEGLKEGYEFIVADLHQGQSENSFSFFGSERTRFVINDLVDRELYEIVCQEGDAIALGKIKDTTGKLNYPFPIEIEEK